jgi:hypothetical protein
MYYDYPEEEEAYDAKNQYMFGDEMLIAPVVKPVNPENEMVEVEIWLPDGFWFDTSIGDIVDGGKEIKRRYMLSEIPVFVRPGTVIPEQRLVKRLDKGSYRNLGVTIFPGQTGSYMLYEDDGLSNDYIQNKFAQIQILHEKSKATHRISLKKAGGTGSFDGFLRNRSLEIRLPGTIPPEKVKVDGVDLKWNHHPVNDGWKYNGFTSSTIIRISDIDIVKGASIEVEFNPKVPETYVSGLKGLMTRLERISYYSNLATSFKITHPEERLPIELAQTGNRISRNPQDFVKEIKNLRKQIKHLPDVLDEFISKIENEEKREYLQKAINIFNLLKEMFG